MQRVRAAGARRSIDLNRWMQQHGLRVRHNCHRMSVMWCPRHEMPRNASSESLVLQHVALVHAKTIHLLRLHLAAQARVLLSEVRKLQLKAKVVLRATALGLAPSQMDL